MTPEPFLSVTIGATPDEVWRALRDPAEIARWFGWEYPGLDAEIAVIFTAEEDRFDDEARTFRTGAHLLEVTEVEGGAVVRLTRVVDVGDEGWEAFHADIDHIEEGWRTFVQQLAFAVTRHPGEDRRTVFGMAPLAGPDALAVLGLASLPAPGERYEAAPGPGDPLTGTVWFRSEHQVGLTVDVWGDGLLVAAALPGGTGEATPALAIASTYGLGDDALAALTERWAAWWAEHGLAPPEDEPEA